MFPKSFNYKENSESVNTTASLVQLDVEEAKEEKVKVLEEEEYDFFNCFDVKSEFSDVCQIDFDVKSEFSDDCQMDFDVKSEFSDDCQMDFDGIKDLWVKKKRKPPWEKVTLIRAHQ